MYVRNLLAWHGFRVCFVFVAMVDGGFCGLLVQEKSSEARARNTHTIQQKTDRRSIEKGNDVAIKILFFSGSL